MNEFYELESLVKLFNPPRNDDDSDSDHEICDNTDQQWDVDENQTTTKKSKASPYAKIEPEKKQREEFDVCDMDNTDATSEIPRSDWKKTPKWNISYRQNVSASDVFLQMGAKTPATASCEHMIVTIDLPGEHMQNMDIKVNVQQLEVHSPNFYLKIPLPQPVHPQKGDAKWDKDQERLVVTLTMEREFDFINF